MGLGKITQGRRFSDGFPGQCGWILGKISDGKQRQLQLSGLLGMYREDDRGHFVSSSNGLSYNPNHHLEALDKQITESEKVVGIY